MILIFMIKLRFLSNKIIKIFPRQSPLYNKGINHKNSKDFGTREKILTTIANNLIASLCTYIYR